MLIVLGLQGILGIGAFNTMTESSRVLFDTGMQQIYELTELANTFDKLQLSYLKDLQTAGQNSVREFQADRQTVRDQLDSLQKVYPDNIRMIQTELAVIEEIMRQPLSSENYGELENAITQIGYASDNTIDEVRRTTLVALGENKRYSDASKRNTLILLCLGTGFAVLFGLAIAVPIARPLKAAGITANALAEGDLTKTISSKGSVEVAAVIKSLNMAVVGLRELVRGINEQANILNNASQELKVASADTSKSAMEVSRAMEELANASTEQTTQVNQVVENINSLASLVRQVSDEMRDVSAESENIAHTAKLGQKASADVANEIVKIYDTTRDVTMVITELDKTSEEIGEITAVIEGIAEQTTLLALNASIEAARAGEYGKGFAIVAHETGKLADQSKQAAQLITNLINKMKDHTAQAVQSIGTEMTIVAAGKTMATEATVTFESIFDKLGNILARIDAAALFTQKMAERNETVIAAVTNIAALSEEGMASTEEVSATAEEQSASVEQVNALAENLAEISANLKQSVAKFQIGQPGST